MSEEYQGPFYVVAVGAQPGIYPSYWEAARYTNGYQKQDIKKYETWKEAKAAFSQRSRSDYNPKKAFTWGPERPTRRR